MNPGNVLQGDASLILNDKQARALRRTALALFSGALPVVLRSNTEEELRIHLT